MERVQPRDREVVLYVNRVEGTLSCTSSDELSRGGHVVNNDVKAEERGKACVVRQETNSETRYKQRQDD